MFIALITMVIWDIILLIGQRPVTPMHKQLLFMGFVCWFITIMVSGNSDDDWAGQY